MQELRNSCSRARTWDEGNLCELRIVNFMMRRSIILKRMLPFLLALDLVLYPAAALAGPNIPGFYGGVGNLVPPAANTLPVIKNIVSGVPGLEQVGDNRLIVHQDDDKAVLEWKSFDIGANAWTHFDQKGNTSWSALNRIYDRNPSQIFGRLTADGNVYLINQNGMLFSPGATVDVHGLVASSLNIKNDAFLDDLLIFEAQNYQGVDSYDASAVAVANHGTIRTDDSGAVLLIGPTVENSGTITAPLGRIILASGTDATMVEGIAGAEVTFDVTAGGDSNAAVNHQTGRLEADLGLVGMFGRVVNQEGVIKAVTAVRRNGRIELKATENLTLGEDSLTESPISPSDETLIIDETIGFKGGNLALSTGERIELKSGSQIIAPSGTVSLNAGKRIYVDDGSRIDVSGNWVIRPAETSVASTQFNSVELKDDHAQKESILRGQKVYFNVVEGTGIGDVSGTLKVEKKTALEHSTKGGIIELASATGDVIARSGAQLDFSGGGIIYDEGFLDTTVVVSGNQVHRIEEASDILAYDTLIGPDNPLTSTNRRFGISEFHDGTYHVGSVNAIRNFCAGYHEGADAGELTLIAPAFVLNATLDGSVTPGIYQTADAEGRDAYGYQRTRGIKRPAAGRLFIGGPYSSGFWQDRDPLVKSIVLSPDRSLLSNVFDATGVFPELLAGESTLSTNMLNDSGLREIILSVRETIVVEKDAAIHMDPTSSLTLAGRHIEHHGTITIPEGSVSFILANNLTSVESGSASISVENLGYERIYLAGDSRIDVSGRQVDMSQVVQLNGEFIDPGFISGGDVILEDWTVAGEGIHIMTNAGIDVSGGWRLDDSGQVSGGDAGTIQIAGSAINLEGDLYTHSLADADGGKLDLHAQQVIVAVDRSALPLPAGFGPTDPLPDGLDNHLIVSQAQIDRTGAATIELTSITDLTVGNGVTLSPSTMKLAPPCVGAKDTNGDMINYTFTETTAEDADNETFMRVAIDQIRKSGISLTAGKTLSSDVNEYVLPDEFVELNRNATAHIAPKAGVLVSPQGKIDISGPSVEIVGMVSAPAGTIDLSAASNLSDMALTIRSGALVSAAAYHPPTEQLSATGLAVGYELLAGGGINVSAIDLLVEKDAVLDVSGSEPIESLLMNPDGSYRKETVAGKPGTIQIEYYNKFQLDGELKGHAALDDMPDGTLFVEKTDISTACELRSQDLQTYIQSGFDDITIASNSELIFMDSTDVRLGRKLTLDAPVISTADQAIALRAPWIELTNTYFPAETLFPSRKVGGLNLSGGWIDITGDVILSGFDSISLNAGHDIRLADYYYDYPSRRDEWRGRLATDADMVINADRVYPTTQSIFSISTAGDVTTLATVVNPSEDPIYSAGGSLSLEAANILHMGRWAAPMGQLYLAADEDNGRVYLESGSRLSVAGDTRVNYGRLDDNAIIWLSHDKSSSNAVTNRIADAPFEELPETDVRLGGSEVITRDGALVDISGGGEIFAYHFLPGIEGSTDPLKLADRMVIVPDMSAALPGQAVFLEGDDLIDAGVYTILPENYAFLDGAVIIEDQGAIVATDGNASLSGEGFSLTVGHMVVADTDLVSSPSRYYSVRPATAVLAEGNFTIEQMTVGDAGAFSVTAGTTILNGTLNASPLDGFTGGTLAFSSRIITASTTGARLPNGFFHRTPIPDELAGRLIIEAAAISEGGFDNVVIGDLTTTEDVVFEAGSSLTAANLTISATDRITVEANSRLSASGNETGGILRLVSPAGQVSTGLSSTLHATHDVQIETNNLDLGGTIVVDNSSLSLIGDRIFITPEDHGDGALDGLVIDGVLWDKIGGIDTVGLASQSDITFLGDINMQAADTLILDADRIVLEADAAATVTIAASQIHLQNTSLAGEVFANSGGTAQNGSGSLDIDADDVVIHFGPMADQDATTVSTNDLTVAAAMTIRAAQGVVASGEGSLLTGGDLSIESAAIATALSETTTTDGLNTITTADVKLVSDTGIIFTRSNGNPLGTLDGYGGKLTLQGRAIDHAGLINSPSGMIRLVATGSETGDGVFLRDGSRLDAGGTQYAAGGGVSLESEQGTVEIAADAGIDVSAGVQGDAGTLSIAAPAGDVRILGDLYGQASGGSVADFTLDNRSIADFAAISNRLTVGGFSGNIDLRARQGNVAVGSSDSLAASSIKIVADAGDVDVRGTLAVSGANGGGTLEIDAGNDLHLFSGSNLDAGVAQSGAGGGKILLAAQTGTIRFDADAQMNVGGGSGGGNNGTITLRALRDGNGLCMDLNGNITGASAFYAEGVSVYDGITTVNAEFIDTLMADAAAWMEALDFQHRLTGVDAGDLHILPEIEIRSDADLSVQGAIDFSRYTDDLPYGTLTLRSAGSLAVNKNIIDARTPVLTLREKTAAPSWGLNLVAGADLKSSDILAVNASPATDNGHLTIGDGVLIYTENAPIRFASAGNTKLGTAGSQNPMTITQMAYNIGSFSGSMYGHTGGDMIIKDGGIQTTTGDIRLSVGGDLNLEAGNKSGAVRTIGEAPDPESNPDQSPSFLLFSFWEYAHGGSITLDVGGDIAGRTMGADAWDASSFNRIFYHADYRNGGSKGIVTMAGGDIAIHAGGDIACAAGLFKEGDLDVVAGNDLNGRFLIGNGYARLETFENFGMREGFENQPIEAFDARIELVAQGGIGLGTVLNPTIANQDYNTLWDLGYTENTAVALESVRGDVILAGETRFYLQTQESLRQRSRVIPATLTIDAAKDILLENSFFLAPAATGNLILMAGGDIRSNSDLPDGFGISHTLAMSDADPSLVYGSVPSDAGYKPFSVITSGYVHTESILHGKDVTPVIIHAGGDVRNLRLFVPKSSEVIAGGGIADIFYHAQNVRLDDVTLISAAHDIRFSSGTGTTFQAGIEVGGPGSVIVTAGNGIDLGTTDGIRVVGNLYNSVLPTPAEENGDPPMRLAVYSGLGFDSAEIAGRLDDTVCFFTAICEQGKVYSESLAQGDPEAAAQILEEINHEVIDPYFDGVEIEQDDLDMVNSQIYSSGNAGDIYIVAAGEINVGKSSLRPTSDQGDNSGIYTTAGGSIDVFVNDDLNVNESRMMTFGGGDITAWTQEGNINAGRGSKTAISVARATVDRSGDEPKIVFTPPAVGSGVRALTFDPDGLEGPEVQPEPGDIYLFAPTGEIDAGEAGIAGKNIILAATQVVNVQNIEVGGASVGVPDASASVGSLGALAGAGTVTETSKIAEEQAGLAGARERFSSYVADLTDTLVPKWVAVEVVGFGESMGEDEDED